MRSWLCLPLNKALFAVRKILAVYNGTWEHETKDLGTSSMGRWDVGTRGTRTRDVNDHCKSRR